MADIGTIMFGKALLLAAGTAATERYQSFKARRRAAGVTLRYDAKRNLHYDPLLRLERRTKIAFRIGGIAFALYAAFVVAVLIGPPLAAMLQG